MKIEITHSGHRFDTPGNGLFGQHVFASGSDYSMGGRDHLDICVRDEFAEAWDLGQLIDDDAPEVDEQKKLYVQ